MIDNEHQLRVVLNRNLVRRRSADGHSLELILPHYGHQISCSEVVELLLDQYDRGGFLGINQHSDVERFLVEHYILLLESEEASLCTGLTKPPAKAIGDFLPSRSLDSIRKRDVCVFGAPFDTACVPPYSPAHGPTVIREAYLNNFSDESLPLIDLGDVVKWPEDGLSTAGMRIEHLIRRVLGKSALPIMLGGDHSTTFFALKALSDVENDFALLQLDAHADLLAAGDSVPLNHANVISHCMNFDSLRHLTQIGLRCHTSCSRAEHVAGRSMTVTEFRQCGIDVLIGQLPKLPLYLTVDMDVLDPQVAPEVTTPLANGISIQELVALVSAVAEHCTLVGADLVEVCATPHTHNHAAKCAAEILSILGRKGHSR